MGIPVEIPAGIFAGIPLRNIPQGVLEEITTVAQGGTARKNSGGISERSPGWIPVGSSGPIFGRILGGITVETQF